jgi:hypothetical protein
MQKYNPFVKRRQILLLLSCNNFVTVKKKIKNLGMQILDVTKKIYSKLQSEIVYLYNWKSETNKTKN